MDRDGGSETIQFVADVSDGSVIVVTHADAQKNLDALRVFYGPPPTLDQRRLIDVERFGTIALPLDGGDIPDATAPWRFRITFEVGVATYSAWLSETTGLLPDGGLIRKGTVDEGNATTPGYIERWPTPRALPNLSFSCL